MTAMATTTSVCWSKNRQWAAAGALAVMFIVFLIYSQGVSMSSATSSETESKTLRAPSSVARPTLQWNPTSIQDLELPESSYKCTGDNPVFQTCLFYNLALYKGQVFFITKDGSNQAVILPQPNLFEVANSPSNHYSLDALIAPEPQSAVKKLITSTLKSTSGGSKELQVLEFETALFGRTRTFNNWYWIVNGAGNFFHRFCKYFDICTREQIQATAILHPILNSTNITESGYLGLPSNTFISVKDLFACFGTILWVNHGDVKVETTQYFDDRLVLLKTMFVGVGDDVVHPRTTILDSGDIPYAQASNEMAVKRVEYLRQCAGLTAVPPQRKRPKIMLVNRPFSDGRSILGLDDVYDRLKRTLPADVEVKVMLPRGSSGLHDQASAFDGSDIVVVPHGAANGNLNFLPYNGIVLVVWALKGRYDHEATLVDSLPKPPYNMTIVSIDCSNKTEPWITGALALPEFRELSPERQIDLLSADMSAGRRKEDWEGEMGKSRLDWMDYKAYHPDPEELTDAILDAVTLWESKPQHW